MNLWLKAIVGGVSLTVLEIHQAGYRSWSCQTLHCWQCLTMFNQAYSLIVVVWWWVVFIAVSQKWSFCSLFQALCEGQCWVMWSSASCVASRGGQLAARSLAPLAIWLWRNSECCARQNTWSSRWTERRSGDPGRAAIHSRRAARKMGNTSFAPYNGWWVSLMMRSNYG